MRVRLSVPALVISLTFCVLVPFLAAKWVERIPGQLQNDAYRTSAATFGSEEDTSLLTSKDQVCTKENANSCSASAAEPLPESNDTTSVSCCTSQHLLFSLNPKREHNDDIGNIDLSRDATNAIATLQQLEQATRTLADSLGINLISFQCNEQRTQQSTPDWKLLRCWGLSQSGGHLSAYKWAAAKNNNPGRRKNPPILLDFILSPTTFASFESAQDIIDLVGSTFAISPERVVWHQAERGFRYDRNYDLVNSWVVDMPLLLLGPTKVYKKHVAHIKTAFQHIDIFDVYDTKTHNVTNLLTSYSSSDVEEEEENFELPDPDCLVYFDTIMQSRKRGLEAYHEALVHPLMLAHPNPQRVAIFGGGEGATLREVLKHKTVEECAMIEIDEEIVQASRQVLRDWNDCSDFVTDDDNDAQGYRSCYNDPRVTIYYEDAIGWFVSRFLDAENVPQTDKFDVIILDSLDPGSMLEFSDFMYGNLDFAKALRGALREGGILGGQVGIEYERELHYNHDWLRMVRNLDTVGFFTLKDYMEGSCGFDDPWKFFVAPTNEHGVARWFASEAQIDLELARRAVATKSGASPFKYIDGATMAGYLAPSRHTENMYCKVMGDDECERGIEPEKGNAPISMFELRPATDPKSGRGVFAKEEIPENTYLALEDGVHSMLIMPATLNLLERLCNTSEDVEDFFQAVDYYAIGYGMWVYHYGEGASIVDPGLLTFVNHGCFGNFHTTSRLSATEQNATVDEVPEELGRLFYNPSVHRHHWVDQGGVDLTDRIVPADQELFDNYLFLSKGASLSDWTTSVNQAKSMCAGQRSSGSVSEYEEMVAGKASS